MYIVKNLKDYRLNHKQRVFASYIKENVSTYNCSEKITNKEYMRTYFAPDNDFLIYSTATVDPIRLITKKS